MDWISAVTGVLSSSGLGSIIGLAGGLITKHVDLKDKAMDLKFKLNMRNLELKESEQERNHELLVADKNIERAQVEGAMKIEALEVGAFTESQKSNKVDGALRFVRPIVTAYLLIGSSFLFYALWQKIGGLNGIDSADIFELLMLMINATIFLTVTCVSWWFGSRGGNIVKKK